MFRSLIHVRVPDELHGRAFAAYNGIRNAAELGAFAAGGVLVAAIGAARHGRLRAPLGARRADRPAGARAPLPRLGADRPDRGPRRRRRQLRAARPGALRPRSRPRRWSRSPPRSGRPNLARERYRSTAKKFVTLSITSGAIEPEPAPASSLTSTSIPHRRVRPAARWAEPARCKGRRSTRRRRPGSGSCQVRPSYEHSSGSRDRPGRRRRAADRSRPMRGRRGLGQLAHVRSPKVSLEERGRRRPEPAEDGVRQMRANRRQR